ncbi:hypothetical protein Tco_0901708 [Tanacetum coccineum]
MRGSYYPIPCLILSTEKDRKTSKRYPDVPTISWRISIRSMDSFQGLTPKSLSSWHRPLASNVPSTPDRRLIKLENQVQCLMEAHLASTQPNQVKKITTPCEIYSGPHDTQYCMENPEQAFVDYASSRTDEARVSDFMASQAARLSKFEADFKRQQVQSTPSQSNSSNKVIPMTEPKRIRKKRERDILENHPDSPTPPDPSISFITEKVLKLNSLFESLRLVPPSPNVELVCTKEEDGDVMFIEIIPKDDSSHKEEPEAGV